MKGSGWRERGWCSGDYQREGCEGKQGRKKEREERQANGMGRERERARGASQRTMGASRVRTSSSAVNQSFRTRYERTGGVNDSPAVTGGLGGGGGEKKGYEF